MEKNDFARVVLDEKNAKIKELEEQLKARGSSTDDKFEAVGSSPKGSKMVPQKSAAHEVYYLLKSLRLIAYLGIGGPIVAGLLGFSFGLAGPIVGMLSGAGAAFLFRIHINDELKRLKLKYKFD